MSNSAQEEPQDQREANSSKKEVDYVEKFAQERIDWSSAIVSIGKRFREVENLYSKRQEALEYQYRLVSIHSKAKTLLSTQWKIAYEAAGKNEDIRFSEKEKTKSAEAATAGLRYKAETIGNQIDFLRDSIKGIDNMTFGIKHRIDIENFKAGAK